MFSLPKSIKIEDIINLDDYKTAEDLALEWDLSIKTLFKSCCVSEDDSKLEYLMKEYITSLTKASTLEDISTLTKTMLCHINFLYSYYSEFKSCFNESYYLENMEEILTIYTNKEVACLKSIKKKNKREYRRHMRLTTRRIIYALTTYLLNREDHIFHVLIKLNSSSCKDTSNSLFRHFFISKKQIEDMSDEGFCRSYIIFQKWKDLCKPDQRTNMDTLLYEMYKRTPECLKTSEMLRKVLAPKNRTTLDVIMQLYSPVSDLSYSYFQYMASKKQCENDAVQSILDSTDDEANISSSDDTDSESSRDFTELINAMSKLNQNLSPTTNSNSARIKTEEMEEDDDVQIVSVYIPNLRNSEVKINTAPRRKERRKSSKTNSSTLSLLVSIQMIIPPSLIEQTPMDTSTTSSASHAVSSQSNEIVCRQENITNNNRENIKESCSSKFGPADSQLCKITEVRSLDSEVDLDEDMLLNSPPENNENGNETASNCTNSSDKITPEEEAHHLSFINSAQSKDSVFKKLAQKSNNVIIDENCVIDNDFGDTVLYDSADGSTYDSNDLNAELYNTNSLENMKTVNSSISSEDIPSSFNKIDTGQNVDKLQNFEVVNTRTINNVKNKPEESHYVNGCRVLKLPLQNCLKQVRVNVVDCNQEKNNGKAPETGGIVFNSKETRKTKNASLEEFSEFELINQNKLQGYEDFKEYNSSLSGPISHYNGATATQFDLYDPDENIDIFLSQSSNPVLRSPQNNKTPQRGRTIDQSDIASPSYEGIADFKIDVKTFFAKPLNVIGENAKNALNINNKGILKKPCLKTTGGINGETDNKAKTHTITFDKYDKIKYFDCSKNNAISRRHEEQHSLVNVSRKSFQYYGIKLNDWKLRQKMSVVLKRLSASQIMRGDPKFSELFQKRKNYKFIRVDYVKANERETGYENNLDACFHQSSTSYRKPQNNSVRTVSDSKSGNATQLPSGKKRGRPVGSTSRYARPTKRQKGTPVETNKNEKLSESEQFDKLLNSGAYYNRPFRIDTEKM